VTLQHTPGSSSKYNKASTNRYGTATDNNNNSFTAGSSGAVDDGALSGLLPQALDMFELAHALGHSTAEREASLYVLTV
jgi:hypothetical protein